jgi:hypothetical protein
MERAHRVSAARHLRSIHVPLETLDTLLLQSHLIISLLQLL